MGLIMASYLSLYGILSGLTKSTDHPSKVDLCLDPSMGLEGLEAWSSPARIVGTSQKQGLIPPAPEATRSVCTTCTSYTGLRA